MDGLYDTLCSDLVNPCDEDINSSMKDDICNNIKQLDIEAHEILYVLIKTFQKNERKHDMNFLPFGGKDLKSGVKFDLDKFPPMLILIINNFIKKHLIKISDDNIREMYTL